MNCVTVTVTRREVAHNWIAVIYDGDRECGWICQDCGMCVTVNPPQNLKERA